MRAEVIAIGDELTSGQRLDTNSRWLSAELGVLGIPVVFHTTAADTMAAGIEAFRVAAARSDIVVATGGLGPTADDLTRDVLAAVAGESLEFSPAALMAVESRFARRGMPMPESNRRQALFPRGSRIIPNPHGTAPGIDVDLPRDAAANAAGGRCRVFALPGVPAEMHVMWRDTVAPALVALLPDVATIVQKTLKCFGAGESAIEALLPDLVRRGREPTVGITAHEATISLRIAARGRTEADCLRQIEETEAVIRECLGDLVFGTGDDELEDAALRAALQAVATVASIEIGTDGRVAALLAQAEARRGGCAPVYVGGTVEPLNAAADPAAVAKLAADARSRFRATCGLAVGRRRPGPEGRESLDIALETDAGTALVEHVVGGGPLLAGSRAAKAAIDLVRLTLSVPAAAAIERLAFRTARP